MRVSNPMEATDARRAECRVAMGLRIPATIPLYFVTLPSRIWYGALDYTFDKQSSIRQLSYFCLCERADEVNRGIFSPVFWSVLFNLLAYSLSPILIVDGVGMFELAWLNSKKQMSFMVTFLIVQGGFLPPLS